MKLVLITIIFLFCFASILFAEIKFVPSLEIGLGNDNNLNYTPAKVSLPGMEKVNDSFYMIIPQLKIEMPIENKEKGIIGFNYQYKYNKYIKKDNGNFNDQYSALSYQKKINENLDFNFQINFSNFSDSISKEDKYKSIGFIPGLKFSMANNQFIDITYLNTIINYSERNAEYDANLVPLSDLKQKDTKQGISILWLGKFSEITTKIGYNNNSNNSNNNNFDYKENNIYLNLWYELAASQRISFKHKYITRQYSNTQIVSGIDKRKDYINTTLVGYEYSITKNFLSLTNWSYSNSQSNDPMEGYYKSYLYTGVKMNW
ncbi:MAG: hypothetical protein HY934_02930 [Candidatus Firestonebacteria bacterium]|nr:hypothetical protein [Candidatus Firestonebacteria bacterium]